MASRNQSSSRGTTTSDKSADKAGEKQPYKVDPAPEKKDTTTSGTDKLSTDKTTSDKTSTTTSTTDKAGEKQPLKVDVGADKKDVTSGASAGKSTDTTSTGTTEPKKTQDKDTSTTLSKLDEAKTTDDKKTATTADKTVSTTTVDKAVVDKLSATVDKGTTDKTPQPFKPDVDTNKPSTTTPTSASTTSTTTPSTTSTTANTTPKNASTTTATTSTASTTATTTTPATTTTTVSDKSADKAGEKQPYKVEVAPEKKDDKLATPADSKSSATPIATKVETAPVGTVTPLVVVAPKNDASSAKTDATSTNAPKSDTTTPVVVNPASTVTPAVVVAPKADSATENKPAATEEKKNLFPLSQSDKSGRENQFRDAPSLAQSVHSGRNPQSHPEQTKPVAEKQVVEPTRPLTESAKSVTIDPLSPPQQAKVFHPAQEPFQPNKAQYPEKLTSVTIEETNPDSLLDEAFDNLKEEVSTGKTVVPQRTDESVVITATETASTIKIEEILRAPETSTTSTGFAGAKPEDKKADIKPSARISTPKHIKTEANDMWTYLGIGVAALAVAGIGAWAYYTKRR